MRRSTAVAACVLGVLVIAGSVAGAARGAQGGVRTPGEGVSVGVNDDAGKYADGASTFWTTASGVGLTRDEMTVLWDETRPTTIVDQSFIEHALPAAQAAGIDVVFDVYPMHSRALTSDPGNVAAFGSFVGLLARTFPSVTQYVVMNECNQTRFVNPQFAGKGPYAANRSAAVCGEALAAGYDALKAVNPGIFVWGVGLSPRGNDRPNARSNVSTSPVRFLGYLGEWYRQSGRTEPLMDGFAFHPYSIPQSLPLAQGYRQLYDAGVANLDRIYEAFYSAFDGTPQRTIGQQPGGGLPVSLNEVGIQTLTDATLHPGYEGVETPAFGVQGATATERYQATWYVKMLNLVACDPNVQAVDLFHLVDESALGGWQSGLYYVGYVPKGSAAAVRQWIAETGGTCAGAFRSWTPPPPPPRAPSDVATLEKVRGGRI